MDESFNMIASYIWTMDIKGKKDEKGYRRILNKDSITDF